MNIPDDVSLDAPVHDKGSCNSDYFTGPGTRTHQFRTYHAKIQTLSNRLVKVANVTVRMEKGRAMCEENMQFADLVNDCGKELITKGNTLIHLSSKISQIRDEFECSLSVTTGKKKHKHIIHLPLPEDPLEDIFVDNYIVITQCDPEEQNIL